MTAQERYELCEQYGWTERYTVELRCPECGDWYDVSLEFDWGSTRIEWVIDDQPDEEQYAHVLEDRRIAQEDAEADFVCDLCYEREGREYAADLEHYWLADR